MPLSFRYVVVLCTLPILVLLGCGRTVPIGWSGTYRFQPEPPPVFRYNDGIRIAALNTEFLFDGRDDEGGATFAHKGDSTLSSMHRASVASVIRWLNADVILLSEVENETALRLMIVENNLDPRYQVHFVQGLDTFTGQDVALLSRIPVDTVGRTYETLPIRPGERLQQVSKNLFARLEIGDISVSLIGVHFLARPTDPTRTQRRELQAEIIRRLVERESSLGRSVIVLGDFNDFDESIPDIAGSRPVANTLARIKSAGNGPNDDLRNLLGEVPQVKRFTAHYDRNDNGKIEFGELSAIDHVLVSPDIYSHIREVRYIHAHDPVSVTDHFPIVFTIASREVNKRQ